MSESRRLSWNEGTLAPVLADAETAGPDEVCVRVQALLIPKAQHEEGFWCGTPEDDPSVVYGGWGPLANRICCSRSAQMDGLKAASLKDTLLRLPAIALRRALAPHLNVERAAVLGGGPLAELVRRLLTHAGITVATERTPKSVHLLVNVMDRLATSEETEVLDDEGTLVEAMAPWTPPADFNFYPDVHRRSLTLVCPYWHTATEAAEDEPLDERVTRDVQLGEWVLYEWS